MSDFSLNSDFNDYYDTFFNRNSDQVFSRRSDQGMSRSEMLIYLERMGLQVPLHGRVDNLGWELKRKYLSLFGENGCVTDELAQVVVYLDQRSHRGEGKVKVPYSVALKTFPTKYCSEYIGPVVNNGGVSLRMLQVGVRRFWLRYTSTDDWRSNCGNGDVILVGEDSPSYHSRIQFPLFAIDFVAVAGVGLYAVDFNESPQIMGTPVCASLPAQEASELIKRAIEHFRPVEAEF